MDLALQHKQVRVNSMVRGVMVVMVAKGVTVVAAAAAAAVPALAYGATGALTLRALPPLT